MLIRRVVFFLVTDQAESKLNQRLITAAAYQAFLRDLSGCASDAAAAASSALKVEVPQVGNWIAGQCDGKVGVWTKARPIQSALSSSHWRLSFGLGMTSSSLRGVRLAESTSTAHFDWSPCSAVSAARLLQRRDRLNDARATHGSGPPQPWGRRCRRRRR